MIPLQNLHPTKTMLDPYKCTIKEARDYAQSLKRSYGDIGEYELVMLHGFERDLLIAILNLCHPNGDRINIKTAEVTIAPKQPNCDRPGTSSTCYYIKPYDGSQFHPVWFADCRAVIRASRLKSTTETVAV